MANKQLRILVFLAVFVALRPYDTQAQNHETIGRVDKVSSKRNDRTWFAFPYTIQINPYMGFTKNIPQRLKRTSAWKHWQPLRILGVTVDVGVFQIRKFLWKHFQCYPKLGLAINYGRLENKGDLMGGLLYLEPRHNYLAKYEVVPRLGIGITYANIPGTNFKKEDAEEEEKIPNDEAFKKDWYRQGPHLDLSIALAMYIQLTPHWQLSPCVGFSYMPLIGKDQSRQGVQRLLKDTDLKIFSGSIGLGYTPNPSLVHYTNVSSSEKSNAYIGLIAARKKQQTKDHDMTNPLKNTESESEYCNVWGVYGQGSLQLYKHHALTLATEWFHDGAIKQKLTNTVKPSPIKVGFLVGHEFCWGKIRFGQQLGFYLKTNDIHEIKEKLPTYARLRLNYQLTEYIFVGTSLKTAIFLKEHASFAEIDFLDFSIGYSF